MLYIYFFVNNATDANDTCIKRVGHRYNPKSSRGLIFQSLTTFPLSASKPTKICL